jgi:tetratricopeptide (TPR) repeat protein/predicted Ser/Thr protein kinase
MLTGCLGTETVSDFLEGLANPDARARIEQHASQCEVCREVLSSLARSGPPPSRPASRPERPEIDRALAPGTRVGRYVVAHEVGAGGMGVVYAAHDPELDRMVAVKLLRGGSHRSTQERLRREAQAMAQLAHPHVVAVYDVGAFDDRTFIAMEYVPGQTLARWNTAPRSQRDVLEAYGAAGRGLAAAHAAGLVHRDFKPENVFVGHDGRVRVGDFGIARTTGALASTHSAALAPGTPSADEAPAVLLTAPGTVLGTPYYMAPELYDGAEADARSDQFSFCVALFTALHGERPFDGDSFASLASNVRAGRVRDPRPSPRVSRRVRAAIQRGLAIDPAARFASLDELLVELAPASRRRARWAVGLGAALVVSLGVIAWQGASTRAAAPDQRCTGAAAAFATTWNAERRGAIEAAFTASRAPYAATALREVPRTLDQYAARWTQAHTEACRATRILGQQTEAALELRMMCLERRRQEAAALIDTLATADRPVVAESVTAALGLPDVTACADLVVLRQLDTLPADPTTLARLRELIRRLDDARAKLATGSYARALDLTRAIVPAVHALGYLPVEAEAELQQGLIERMLGDAAGAEASLLTAAWSAEAGRNDVIAARTWTALVFVVGLDRGDYARALTLAPRATAAIARLGGNADLEASLERALGGIAFERRDLDAAVAHLENERRLEERVFGTGHLSTAGTLGELGLVALAQGHADLAVQLARRVLEIDERALGPEHPSVAFPLSRLGIAHAALGDYVAAEREERRALAIRERAFGPAHPALAENLSDLAQLVRRQGRSAEALVLARRAVAIGETALGLAHPDLADPLIQLGLTLGHLGRYAEAAAPLGRAEAITARALGPDHVRVMPAVIARGDLLMLQSRWRDAAALYERAIPILESSQGAGDALASAVSSLCRAQVELQRPARALAPLERLASKLGDQPPELRGAIQQSLARALWDTGGDRARARELATQAWTGARAIADAGRDDRARLERWLASHRVP